MLIPVKVKKRLVTCKKFVVSGNVETYTLDITFDDEWEGYDIRVIFDCTGDPEGPRERLLTGNTINIPWESIRNNGLLYLTFRGSKMESSEILLTKKMDAPISVEIHGTTEGDSEKLEPTPSAVDDIYRIAQSVRDDADMGKFNGKDGKDGDKGDPGPEGPQGPQGPKGDTYNLTEQDKIDISRLIEVFPELPAGDVYIATGVYKGQGVLPEGIYRGSTTGLTRIITVNESEEEEFFNLYNFGFIIVRRREYNYYYVSILNGESIAVAESIEREYQSSNINSGIVPFIMEMYEALSTKQDTLESGTNIKTINGESILGSGDIDIPGSIEDVRVNGISVVSESVADISVPEKTSELDNDSDFATTQFVEQKITDVRITTNPNVYLHGSPTINMGYASGFSATNYLEFPKVISFGNRPFEIRFAIQTGTGSLVEQQNIIDSNFGMAFAIQNSKFILALSSNGVSWNLGAVYGTYNLQPASPYYVKISWDGETYKTSVSTDDVSYIDDIIITSSESLYPRTIYIGVGNLFFSAQTNWFKGTINLNKCYLYIEDELEWQGMSQNFAATDLSNLTEQGEKLIHEIASSACATKPMRFVDGLPVDADTNSIYLVPNTNIVPDFSQYTQSKKVGITLNNDVYTMCVFDVSNNNFYGTSGALALPYIAFTCRQGDEEWTPYQNGASFNDKNWTTLLNVKSSTSNTKYSNMVYGNSTFGYSNNTYTSYIPSTMNTTFNEYGQPINPVGNVYTYKTYSFENDEWVSKGITDVEEAFKNAKNDYRFINQIELTEEATFITIDKDSNGNSFELNDVNVTCYIPKSNNANDDGIIVKMSSSPTGTSEALGTMVYGGTVISKTTPQYFIFNSVANGQGIISRGNRGTNFNNMPSAVGGYNSMFNIINALTFRCNNASYLLPIGTKVLVWGK